MTEHGAVGWDMPAALVIAEALGLERLPAIELLSVIEPIAISKMNERLRSG